MTEEATSKQSTLRNAIWTHEEPNAAVVQLLTSDGTVGPIVARCLALRGVTTWDEARDWLHPKMSHLHDPNEIDGMDLAVKRLEQAIANQEHVRVVTDYDVDGTTSSLIIQAMLKLRGLTKVTFFIPHRMRDGYGFSENAARAAAEDGADLIVTADIGVKDHASVSLAVSLGVDVIVLDHHLPAGGSVPEDAVAVLCPPQLACSYPNPDLAACGVSLKLAQRMLADHPKADIIVRSMLKLAAIGTVADVVNLATRENRAIVTLGLRELNRGPHAPGLQALLNVSSLKVGEIEESDLGFRIGPRINAAGRMDSALAVVDLFSERNPATAAVMAQALDDQNGDRRNVQRRILTQAQERIDHDNVPAFVVVSGDEEEEGWHRGVVGIVAARLRDQFHRPAAVLAINGEFATASVRSTPDVHAVMALEHASDLLVRFGGHPAAAGLTIRTENIDALRARLAEAALMFAGGEMPQEMIPVDAHISESDLVMPLYEELQSVGPFGKGNRRPNVVVEGVRLSDVRMMKEAHLSGKFGNGCRAVWWRAAEHFDAVASGRKLDLLGNLEVNTYRGYRNLQFRIEDARFSV